MNLEKVASRSLNRVSSLCSGPVNPLTLSIQLLDLVRRLLLKASIATLSHRAGRMPTSS